MKENKDSLFLMIFGLKPDGTSMCIFGANCNSTIGALQDDSFQVHFPAFSASFCLCVCVFSYLNHHNFMYLNIWSFSLEGTAV